MTCREERCACVTSFVARWPPWQAAWLVWSGPVRAEGEPIRIAYLAPLSGSLNVLGFEEWLKNFKAAADEVNARGGVPGGRKIEIVPFDNKGSPQESLLVFKQVVDQDIHYVAATISSVALALSDAIQKHNERNPGRRVLFLDYDAREPSLTESKCSFWHFRFVPHADMGMNVLTDYIAQHQDVHNVFLLNQDYAWGHSVAHAATAMLGRKRPDIRIVGNDLIPLGKVKDFSPYVAKIAASGADAVRLRLQDRDEGRCRENRPAVRLQDGTAGAVSGPIVRPSPGPG